VLQGRASGWVLDGELVIHADQLVAAGWSPPDDGHPVHWWLELHPSVDPSAYATMAHRLVVAVYYGFGIASPDELAYRAWQDGTLEPLVYPELPLPRIDVYYYARLGPGDTTDNPFGLLRRLWIGERVVDQAFGRDLSWLPTRTLAEADRGELLDRMVSISRVEASGVANRWREQSGAAAPPPDAAAASAETRRAEPGPGGGQSPALREAKGPAGLRDADGNLVTPTERLVDPERTQVVEYLREAPVLAYGYGFDQDPYHPEHPEVVPIHIHTDGEWVWSESLAYYAQWYGFAPDPELLEHIRRRGYRWPDLPREARIRVAQQYREGGAR